MLRGVAESQHLSIAQVNRDAVNWILLAADPSMLQTRGLAEISAPPASDRPPLLWTDDYSNVFQVFRGIRP